MRSLRSLIHFFLFFVFFSTISFAASINLKENPDNNATTIASINSLEGILIVETPLNLSWLKVADRRTTKIGWILKTDLVQLVNENNQFMNSLDILMGNQSLNLNLNTDNTNIMNQNLCQENHLAQCLNILIQKQNQLEIQLRFIIDYLTNYPSDFPNANIHSNYPIIIPHFNFPKILPNQNTVMPIITPNINLNQPAPLQIMKSEKQNNIEQNGNTLSITTNKN